MNNVKYMAQRVFVPCSSFHGDIPTVIMKNLLWCAEICFLWHPWEFYRDMSLYLTWLMSYRSFYSTMYVDDFLFYYLWSSSESDALEPLPKLFPEGTLLDKHGSFPSFQKKKFINWRFWREWWLWQCMFD